MAKTKTLNLWHGGIILIYIYYIVARWPDKSGQSQTVCKSYQQMALVGKELRLRARKLSKFYTPTITYLLKTAFTDTLTGMLAINSPFSEILGSMTWHFKMGMSLTVTSFCDLKITWTAVCLSWGARVPFEGSTENRFVTFGLAGSAFSNRKLKTQV